MLSFFHGDKGGVGKSFVARTFADKMLAEEREFSVVESDTRNPDLLRHFQDVDGVEIHALDLSDYQAWLDLLTVAHEHGPDHQIVVSLPAQFGREQASSGAKLLAENSAEIGGYKIWWVMSKVADSISLLRELMATDFGQNAAHVTAVLNGFFGPREAFARWDESKTRKELLKVGSETYFPELYFRFVDEIRGPFSSALDSLNFGDRLSLQAWIRTAHAALATE